MIISRLTKAVREQNWFAVALEFVIVISGVAIGFQITAWNETRQDEAREALVLARLQTDFEVIHANTETALADLEQRAGHAAAFVEVITDEAVPSHSEDFRTALALTIGTPVPAGRSATYIELLASGEMRLVRSEALRRALVEFDEQVRRHELAYGTLAQLVIDNNAILLEYQSLLIATQGENGPYQGDIERIRTSAELLSSAQLMDSVSRFNLSWHQGRLETADAVLQALAAGTD
ncbi:hypothetical protein [Maricaulis sp.]|uniref:hypothetical protein n=1 Tax=Maricaulis sp. TaxID=1486257 RepID=UPI0026063401|nr:hypothetical protein [Maricaulis sp.]